MVVLQTHLPGYIESFDEIKAKGVDVIACVSVNDAFVMSAWGESHGANGKIRMLADTTAQFTKVSVACIIIIIINFNMGNYNTLYYV